MNIFRRIAAGFGYYSEENRTARIYSLWGKGRYDKVINIAKTDGKNVDDITIDGKKLASLIGLVDKKTINRTIAKEIFAEIYKNNVEPEEYVSKNKLGMVSDESLIIEAAKEAISENPKSVSEYKEGNQKVLGFFMGIIMRKTSGKADPAVVNGILKKLLDE